MLFICARWWWEGETIETQTMNPSKKECFFVQILLPTRSFCCRFELPPNDTICSTVLGLFYSVFDSQLFFYDDSAISSLTHSNCVPPQIHHDRTLCESVVLYIKLKHPIQPGLIREKMRERSRNWCKAWTHRDLSRCASLTPTHSIRSRAHKSLSRA